MTQFTLSDTARTSLLTIKQMSLSCCTILIALLFFMTPNSIAAGSETAPQLSDSPEEMKPFQYQLEDRADPFVPFITAKSKESSVNMNEIVEKKATLTGMQLFEPGQLTLVALLKAGTDDIAMVQDFTGKGYMLREGVKIGRRGVVKDITSNRVIIEETAETRAGKKIITEVVMLLKKEGEK
ncbi:MAG: pilus assembly protein PilP [Deltaproteobacteria bacterium]|nr:pilus assembly protein PilP [Deltaproteobacteria bacterium]